MTTKERILAEIDNLDEDNLDELYRLVHQFAEVKVVNGGQPGILAKLKTITIDAPPDFMF